MPQSSPLQELSLGLRRMLSPPGPTTHRTPDNVDERQSSPAQPAVVHTDVPVDAPAAAPGRMLHSTDEPRSALPASTTTSAALLDPPPGLQSPSLASVAAPANAPAHDPQPFTLSNTTYVPYVGRDNRLTVPPTYHQPTASDDASSQAPPRLTEPYSADVSDHRRPLAARPPLDRYSPLAVTDTTDPSAFGFSARDAPKRPSAARRLPRPSLPSAPPLLPPSTTCLLYTSPSPRDKRQSRMPSSA